MIPRTYTPQSRTRFSDNLGVKAKKASELDTLRKLEEFLEGRSMLLTCSIAESQKPANGGPTEVIVIATNDVPVVPQPTVDPKGYKITWQGVGEVISIQPFLNLVKGTFRAGYRFEAHISPTNLWCSIKFARR